MYILTHVHREESCFKVAECLYDHVLIWRKVVLKLRNVYVITKKVVLKLRNVYVITRKVILKLRNVYVIKCSSEGKLF